MSRADGAKFCPACGHPFKEDNELEEFCRVVATERMSTDGAFDCIRRCCWHCIAELPWERSWWKKWIVWLYKTFIENNTNNLRKI